MENLRNLNAELLSRHRDLVDSLTQEAKALRGEEIKFAESFAKLPPEIATPDTFKLFMRDIHSAHEELQSRLQNIINSKAAQELYEAQKYIQEMEGVLDEAKEIIEDLQSQQKQSEVDIIHEKRSHDDETSNLKNKIKSLEASLTCKNDRINSLEKKISHLEEQQGNVKGYAAYLKKEFLVALHHDREWDLKDISTCALIEKLLGWQKDDLQNIANCRGDLEADFDAYTREFSRNRGKISQIKDKIEKASQNLGYFSKAKTEAYLKEAQNILDSLLSSKDSYKTAQKITDSLNELDKQLNYAKDKCVAISSRMSQNSLLPRFISELKGSVDNFS